MKDRAGQQRYWQVVRYPENIDLFAGYATYEVLDAGQDERVEGVVLAEFPPLEQTVEWFNGRAYVQARKSREANEYLGMLVELLAATRTADTASGFVRSVFAAHAAALSNRPARFPIEL